MKFSILTLFPEMFEGPFHYSIIKRAIEKQAITIEFINIREFGLGKHKIVDDKPYGGGVGMLLRVDVVHKAIEHAKCPKKENCNERIILLDPKGMVFKQKEAKRLTKYDHLILLCGRYEGIDERIKKFIDQDITTGDYVLTGGELPAMVVTDSIVRLLPGVLGKDESSYSESFQEIDQKTGQILEHPQYTRPEIYLNMKVPSILLSGDHKKIASFRKQQALIRTQTKRPDLLKTKDVTNY